MGKIKKTKFYEFKQNNSGGFFDVDKNVCHRVVIEAHNKTEAIKKFLPMIKKQSPSCSCCGDRWYPDYPVEIVFKKQGFDTIDDYYQFMANNYGWTKPDARIHYLDGKKKEIFIIK